MLKEEDYTEGEVLDITKPQIKYNEYIDEFVFIVE